MSSSLRRAALCAAALLAWQVPPVSAFGNGIALAHPPMASSLHRAVLGAAALLAWVAPPVSAYDNGVTWARKPPRGWSSWCTDDLCGLIDYCDETEVLQIADAMVNSGMTSLNYSLILLDDCWSSVERDSAGDLQPDATRFPSGIDALVEAVHARGLYLGLYTCAGERTCKNNRTGSGGHYEADAKWFARHNVDYIKVRFSCRVAPQSQPLPPSTLRPPQTLSLLLLLLFSCNRSTIATTRIHLRLFIMATFRPISTPPASPFGWQRASGARTTRPTGRQPLRRASAQAPTTCLCGNSISPTAAKE